MHSRLTMIILSLILLFMIRHVHSQYVGQRCGCPTILVRVSSQLLAGSGILVVLVAIRFIGGCFFVVVVFFRRQNGVSRGGGRFHHGW